MKSFSKIFKKKIPIEILFNLLDELSLKFERKDEKRFYLFCPDAFRKGVYLNKIDSFLKQLNDDNYYHDSQRKYINPDQHPITYNGFTSIIRQICKSNNILFKTQIQYLQSKYNILYKIYY